MDSFKVKQKVKFRMKTRTGGKLSGTGKVVKVTDTGFVQVESDDDKRLRSFRASQLTAC